MLCRLQTTMVVWLAASAFVLPNAVATAQQPSAIPGVGPMMECTPSAGGIETGAAKLATGCTCKRSAGAGRQSPIVDEGSFALPAFANQATVFLSGWIFQYMVSTDHKVAQIETHIDNIRLTDQTLMWRATGILRDRNFDDWFDWCYYYTVLAWDDTQLSIRVDHGERNTSNHVVHTDDATATVVLPSYSRVPGLNDARTAGVLPRGFGFAWGTKDPNADPAADLPDNNLLQLAYDVSHREQFVEHPKAYGALPPPPLSQPVSQIDASIISWESLGILKDNDRARDYRFMEVFSVLSGDDVRINQPPFTILPVEDEEGFLSTCVSSGTGKVLEQQFVIDNIPFEHAIPLLTGWDLSFDCDDEHVRRIGAWLSDMQYEKAPNSAVGRMRYTVSSILQDKNDDPAFTFHHKVDILGLRITGGAPVKGSALP